MIVYLSGPIANMTEEEAGAWRTLTTEVLGRRGITTIDPFLLRDYRNRRADSYDVAEVVEADKHDIRKSDIVLANCHVPSVGTSMEILYAWEQRKLVVIVHPDPPNASPWLHYHSEVVWPDLGSAVNYIQGLVEL